MKIPGFKTFKQLGDEVAARQAKPLQTEAFTLTVARYSERAIAFKDGTQEDRVDPDTGEVKSRDKWFWFPKSLVQIEGYDRSEDEWPDVGETVVAHLPRRMAEERGLT